MYETANFSGLSVGERLYLSVTHRTREERQSMFDSYCVAHFTSVARNAFLSTLPVLSDRLTFLKIISTSLLLS